MIRLSRSALGELPPRSRPAVDRPAVGIVHLGAGAFHRAHQAVYTERAIELGGGDWGIAAISPRGSQTAQRLREQDGLYSLRVVGGEEDSIGVLGVLAEIASLPAAPTRVRDLIASPSTCVVTATITEWGYHDPRSPVIAALAEGLRRRHLRGSGPLTVLSCDNLRGNGSLLRRAVLRQLGTDADLIEWIDGQVAFPDSMVDRIVPPMTAADVAHAQDALGVTDLTPVRAEPFSQWVIQDRFVGPRPAWEAAGAILTDDVEPWETAKLRLLNGTHSALAYLGALAGHETIAEAVGDDELAQFARRLIAEELSPSLATVPAELDLARYEASILHRFANRALRHRTRQVARDGSQKLAERVLPVLTARRQVGEDPPPLSTTVVAAWMAWVTAERDEIGRPVELDDARGDELRRIVASTRDHPPQSSVDALLAVPGIFPDELRDWPALRQMLIGQLGELRRAGVANTITRSLEGASA